MDSPEDCLRQAEECDRLAAEAQLESNRQVLLSAAAMWRKLATGYDPVKEAIDKNRANQKSGPDSSDQASASARTANGQSVRDGSRDSRGPPETL